MIVLLIAFCFGAVVAIGVMDIIDETRPAPARAPDKPGERA